MHIKNFKRYLGQIVCGFCLTNCTFFGSSPLCDELDKKKNSLPAHKLDEDLFKGFDLLHRVGKAEEACLGSTDCIFAFLEDDPAWG